MDSNSDMGVPEQKQTILVVEDEAVARNALRILLSAYGYQTHVFASGEDALRYVHGQSNRLIALIDLDLPGMSGDQLLQRLKSENPDTEVVIITAASAEHVGKLTHDPHITHLRKPLDFHTLLDVLSGHRGSEHPSA